MSATPFFSLIVPTRQRAASLRAFLESVAATADCIDSIEVVLVTDSDDPGSREVSSGELQQEHVVVSPGLTMGALNQAGYQAATGRYLMLLNDDVLARTRGWDRRIRQWVQRYPDEIVLIHVEDGIFHQNLCTFPTVSRTFCELAGGICPREYVRYRIDDHIEDVFNLLGVLGERRTFYFPEVVFEHTNYLKTPEGRKDYSCDPAILALDAPRFEALLPARKQLAIRLKGHIEGRANPTQEAAWRSRLLPINDSRSLRASKRLRVVSSKAGVKQIDWARKVRESVRQVGYRGMVRLALRKTLTYLR